MKTITFLALGIWMVVGAGMVVPTGVQAAQSKNTNTGITYECGDDTTAGNCDFADFVAAAQKVINWGTTFGLFFSVVIIAYAGSKYLMYGDNAGERKKANDMLQSVGIGIVWILAAWAIVNLITTQLLGVNFGDIFKRP